MIQRSSGNRTCHIAPKEPLDLVKRNGLSLIYGTTECNHVRIGFRRRKLFESAVDYCNSGINFYRGVGSRSNHNWSFYINLKFELFQVVLKKIVAVNELTRRSVIEIALDVKFFGYVGISFDFDVILIVDRD